MKTHVENRNMFILKRPKMFMRPCGKAPANFLQIYTQLIFKRVYLVNYAETGNFDMR